jgi:hypothetical protein
VRWKPYGIDLRDYHKVIVGEGESDRSFFAAFCRANNINGFGFAFTGMHKGEPYQPSGFTEFVRYLPVLERQAEFDKLTDLVLVCDTGENQSQKLNALRRQIREANQVIGGQVFTENPDANVVAANGVPRVHVLIIPNNRPGGIETICVDVARDHQNLGGNAGTTIEGWVNTFANSACQNWTTEKRDKLRLQAFLSAAWDSKPDIHFSQLFDITRDQLVPLTGPAFDVIRQFLRDVAVL